jgi:hypothetical protein
MGTSHDSHGGTQTFFFWINSILNTREIILDNFLSITSNMDQYTVLNSMIMQAFRWFGWVFPRGCNKINFLRLCTAYFTNKLLVDYWKDKVSNLYEENVVEARVRKKILNKFEILTSFNIFNY